MNYRFRILKREEEAIITEEFKDISNNDMHVIEAVGIGEGDNMSSVAKKLDITVGSLTTAMNSLVNKKYVIRERSEQDRRVVNVRLTEKGKRAFFHHQEYHHKILQPGIKPAQSDCDYDRSKCIYDHQSNQ